MHHVRRRRLIPATLVALGVAFAVLAASAGRVSVVPHPMTPASGIGSPGLYRSIGRPLAGASGTVLFGCQTSDPVVCYGPDQIRAAYGIQPLLDSGFDGSGRTIAIIEAYGSPTIQSDLATFDSLWGVADPPGFQVVAPFGVDPTSADNASGWAGETSLDVEWAHAIAPGANITLVVAKSSSDADILDATQWVLDNNAGDVLSQSYGEAEQCMDPALLQRQHGLFGSLTRKGITLIASSGDLGAAQFTCDGSGFFKAASTPASDPYVTGVGGTTLVADGSSGVYRSESTWNQTDLLNAIDGPTSGPQNPAAGGGGVSVVYRKPDYQSRVVAGDMRTEPDVSYNAAVYGGVVVVWGGGGYLFGGTSAGAPQWAGLAAIADQIAHARLGAINAPLYAAGTGRSASAFFHDVADGSNNSVPDLTPYFGASFGTPIDGFTAVPGYDLATGLGSPIANTLVPYLADSASGGGEGNQPGDGGHGGNGGGDQQGGGGHGGGGDQGGNGGGDQQGGGGGHGGGGDQGGGHGGDGGHGGNGGGDQQGGGGRDQQGGGGHGGDSGPGGNGPGHGGDGNGGNGDQQGGGSGHGGGDQQGGGGRQGGGDQHGGGDGGHGGGSGQGGDHTHDH